MLGALLKIQGNAIILLFFYQNPFTLASICPLGNGTSCSPILGISNAFEGFEGSGEALRLSGRDTARGPRERRLGDGVLAFGSSDPHTGTYAGKKGWQNHAKSLPPEMQTKHLVYFLGIVGKRSWSENTHKLNIIKKIKNITVRLIGRSVELKLGQVVGLWTRSV